MCQGGAAAWKDHLPWVLLGMWAAPREETGISAAEAALQQQLVVPADMEELPVPPAVIPPTVHSYTEAAAPLWHTGPPSACGVSAPPCRLPADGKRWW